MNNKEKNIENNHQPPVFVDSAKMVQGMSLVFSGAMRILESLGPNITVNADKILPTLTVDLRPDAEETDAQKKSDDIPKAEEHSTSTTTTETSINSLSSAPRVEPDKCNNDSTAITIDDIIKVILCKIKQNKDNNEKIGRLVESYGVAKVKELSPDKYEAFLTDLAAI